MAVALGRSVVPLSVTVVGKAGVVESKRYSVVTEEGVPSVDEGWYVCQWNGSPREVSQEEWEQIVVGKKWSEAE